MKSTCSSSNTTTSTTSRHHGGRNNKTNGPHPHFHRRHQVPILLFGSSNCGMASLLLLLTFCATASYLSLFWHLLSIKSQESVSSLSSSSSLSFFMDPKYSWRRQAQLLYDPSAVVSPKQNSDAAPSLPVVAGGAIIIRDETRIASLVVERRSVKGKGEWSPPLPPVSNTNQRNQKPLNTASHLFILNTTTSAKNIKIHNKKRTKSFLGLVRITKTASTSLLTFLTRGGNGGGLKTHNQLLQLDKYVERQRVLLLKNKKQKTEEGDQLQLPPPQEDSLGTRKGSSLLTCIFGTSESSPSSSSLPQLPNSVDQNLQQTQNTTSIATDDSNDKPKCRHVDIDNLVSTWARSINYLPEVVQHPRRASFQVTLDLITMVRDPLDRFISFFHYYREIYPKWKGTTAFPETRQMLEQGNLEGFLQSLPRSRQYVYSKNRAGLPTLNSGFQYEYLGRQNVDEAISMIQGVVVKGGGLGGEQNARAAAPDPAYDAARVKIVMPLVSECFDASLYLLTDWYPHWFSQNATKSFLESTAATANALRKRKLRTNRKFVEIGIAPEQSLSKNLAVLRQEARNGFLADDYRFYEAAVAQFTRHLLASNVDRSIVNECLHKLSFLSSL